MKKIEIAQNTPEWLTFRDDKIGGSDIAAIIGAEGAFQNRQDVLFQKLGHKRALSEHQKKIFNEGHEWERVVRDALNQSGWNFVPEVVVADWEPRFMASLDGIDHKEKTILEIKSVMTTERFAKYCETTPQHYYAQVQWQLYCTGLERAMIAFVHDGNVFTKNIERDVEMQSFMENHAIKFLQELDAIKAGTMPAPILSVQTTDMERIAFLKRQEKEMQIQLDMVTEEIKSLAEKVLTEFNAIVVSSDGIQVEWVEREGSVDYKKIPELKDLDLKKFRRPGTKYIKVSLKR